MRSRRTETNVEKKPTSVPQPRHRRRLGRPSTATDSVNGSRTSLRSFTLVRDTQNSSVMSSEDKAESKVQEKQGSLKSGSSSSLSEGDFFISF